MHRVKISTHLIFLAAIIFGAAYYFFDISNQKNNHQYVAFDDAMGIAYRKKVKSGHLSSIFKEKRSVFTTLYNQNYPQKIMLSKTAKIPKIIHQIWIGGPLPEKYKRLQKTWIEKHPDWEYRFWTDQNIGQLKLKNKRWFDALKNYGYKADILRLEILKKYGGVYIDMDTECIKPFDWLHHQYDFYAGISSSSLSVANGIIGVIPNHPIIERCIGKIHKNFEKKHPKKCSMRDIFRFVGPPVLTEATLDYCKRKDRKTCDIVLPSSYFYPWFHTHDIPEKQIKKVFNLKTQKDLYKILKPESMSLHYWAGSWWACGENKDCPLNWDEGKTDDKSFVIIVPSYNNKQWYKKNLDSICTQNYSNYRVIYIDDNSSDGTGKKVAAYIQKNKLKNKVTLQRNKKQVGALANIYHAVHQCKDEEIIVLVDGDDWLADDTVLSYLNECYKNNNIWLTYGQYQLYPSGKKGYSKEIPAHIIKKTKIRTFPWVSSHLRTFYAGLFKKIKQKSLQYQHKFLPMAWDLALMFPMLEMAGDHCCFVSKVLYTYNTANSLNDHKVDRRLQQKLDKLIRTKPSYQLLATL